MGPLFFSCNQLDGCAGGLVFLLSTLKGCAGGLVFLFWLEYGLVCVVGLS
jgi:hypothetical protein